MIGEPFQFTSGPRDAKLVIVGEAWGQQEAVLKRPFIGPSGQELTRMLTQAGINRAECLLTNVFQFQPQSNNLDTLCTKKSDLPKGYPHPPLSQGKYFKPEFFPELDRLFTELRAHPRNLVILLGNTACWAVLNTTRISAIRGTVSLSPSLGLKCLPTFHPASVLRNWSQRPIVVADLMKAKTEADFPEIRRPRREVLTDPSLSEIAAWAKEPTSYLAVDIETAQGQIKCIGFATSPRRAMVVPFFDSRKFSGSYWTTKYQEREAWTLVQQLLVSDPVKVFQNGLYDMQYLLKLGFRLRNCTADTMLLQHALYPEMPKSLGFLGSLHSNESSWKTLRKDSEITKRDA